MKILSLKEVNTIILALRLLQQNKGVLDASVDPLLAVDEIDALVEIINCSTDVVIIED